MAFSEARRQGFSPGTLVSPPTSSVNGFSYQNKTKINAISPLSNLITELSLRIRGMRHVAREKSSMCCT